MSTQQLLSNPAAEWGSHAPWRNFRAAPRLLKRLPAVKCSSQAARNTAAVRGRHWRPARPSLRVAAVAAEAATQQSDLQSMDALLRWCIEKHQLPPTPLEPAVLEAPGGQGATRLGFTGGRPTEQGEVLLEIPGDLGITTVDVEKDPKLAALAEGRSELVGLALWLMQERSKGAASDWQPLLRTLPQQTLSPILWSEQEREALLQGSPVLKEAAARRAALQQEWEDIAALISGSGKGSSYPASVFNEEAFLAAMSVVLAHATYLPSAQCFALLPLVGGLARTGSVSGATLDYDLEKQAVTVVAARSYSPGQEVALFDGRPNGELLLATGRVEPANPSDCLALETGLISADRMYMAKRQIVEEMGFGARQEFPIYEDRMPTQLLAYVRLARIQDPALLAKVTFERDVIISQENEYEVLQLLMGDLRDRMSAFASGLEEEVKLLQERDISAKERLAAQLRLSEKRILRGTMEGVRRRLAPIRGIPTKQGFQDPNADIVEIFETVESIPLAPKKLLDGLLGWARGDHDPEWKKQKKGGR